MSKKYPSVPEPSQDARALLASALALKEGYEILSGQRRGSTPPVTWEDLIRLGLASEADIPK